MRAAVVERYGQLVWRDVDRPEPSAGEVLVRVRATSLNAVDWYGLTGRPWVARPFGGVRRPRSPEIGSDFAGIVEAVGEGVTDVQPGDGVYGCQGGSWAEFVVATKAVAPKPANLSFEEAAAVPVAAFSALQALRDHARVEAGQKVLVNGGSGGVGTFAVQLARAYGAEVHAVCSTRNVTQAETLGAVRVFDYTREDFSRSGERYDVIVDVAGSRSWAAIRRALAPGGIVVVVGGPRRRMLGPLGHIARVLLAAKLSRRRASFFIAKPNSDDLVALRDLIEAGQVTPVVERRYDFAEIAEAMRVMADGHARAKIVVTVP